MSGLPDVGHVKRCGGSVRVSAPGVGLLQMKKRAARSRACPVISALCAFADFRMLPKR